MSVSIYLELELILSYPPATRIHDRSSEKASFTGGCCSTYRKSSTNLSISCILLGSLAKIVYGGNYDSTIERAGRRVHAITGSTEDAKRFFVVLAFENIELLIQLVQSTAVLVSINSMT